MDVTEQTPPYRLDDEQRARVRDCLAKDGLSLPPKRFERFIGTLESSIARFLAGAPQATFRDAHDALRDLWELSHDDDPPIGLIRIRVQALPGEAIEYVNRRAAIVIARLFPTEPPISRFQEWAASADPEMLLGATRVLSAEGGRIVPGRSRGSGERSGSRREPVIMGEVRGAGAASHRGGQLRNESHQKLIMHLALDWLTATGKPPAAGRSDYTGFGDLAHCIFQWLRLPEGSAAYALRRYWVVARALKAREPLGDFLRRHNARL